MAPSPTRQIARDAVRDRLMRVTLEQVLAHGFERVTLTDIADAAGVSRSTLIRYVGSKAGAVVSSLMAVGDDIADRVRDWPPADSDWSALRGALSVIVAADTDGQAQARDLVRAIYTSSALSASMWLQRDTWQHAIAAALEQRAPGRERPAYEALAAAAMGCLDVAAREWLDSGGSADFAAALDRAFAVVAAAGRG